MVYGMPVTSTGVAGGHRRGVDGVALVPGQLGGLGQVGDLAGAQLERGFHLRDARLLQGGGGQGRVKAQLAFRAVAVVGLGQEEVRLALQRGGLGQVRLGPGRHVQGPVMGGVDRAQGATEGPAQLGQDHPQLRAPLHPFRPGLRGLGFLAPPEEREPGFAVNPIRHPAHLVDPPDRLPRRVHLTGRVGVPGQPLLLAGDQDHAGLGEP